MGLLSVLQRFGPLGALPKFEGTGPIVAGPWLGEVGFELLYWIPFLTGAVEERPSLKGRLVVVSRGGVEHWYSHLAPQAYVDLFQLFDLPTVKRRLPRFGKQAGGKYERSGRPAFEQAVLEAVSEKLGLHNAPVLHPRVMYQNRHLSWGLRHRMLPPLHMAELPLPSRYVAVRFYAGAPLPETEENRRFVRDLLGRLAQDMPLVLLNTGVTIDRKHPDFQDVAPEGSPGISEHMEVENNLAVQTAAISMARGFVGSYGGLSYLPPLLGVPSFSLYSESARMVPSHLRLARRVFRSPPWGAFHVRSLAETTPQVFAAEIVATLQE